MIISAWNMDAAEVRQGGVCWFIGRVDGQGLRGCRAVETVVGDCCCGGQAKSAVLRTGSLRYLGRRESARTLMLGGIGDGGGRVRGVRGRWAGLWGWETGWVGRWRKERIGVRYLR